LIIIAVNQRAFFAAGITIEVIDADTFALFSAPLFGVLAVSNVVGVLDASLVF